MEIILFPGIQVPGIQDENQKGDRIETQSRLPTLRSAMSILCCASAALEPLCM